MIEIPEEFFKSKWWKETFKSKCFSPVEAYLYLVALRCMNETRVSYRLLSEKWGWATTNVHRFLKNLNEQKLISFDSNKKDGIFNVSVPNGTKVEHKMEHTNPDKHRGFSDTSGTQNGTQSGTQKKKLIKETTPIPPKENYQEKINIINHTHEEVNDPISAFNDWLAGNCSYIHSNITLLSAKEYDKLLSAYSEEQIKETCLQIENRKDLRKRYKSLYRTLLNWLKTNYGAKPTIPLQERKKKFQESLRPYLDEFGRDTLNRFYAHWSQIESGDKDNPRMRFEMEKFFELENQLFLWRQRT